MISIGKAINSILVNVPDLVSSRVYPQIAPENCKLPFIVYDRENVTPLYTKDGLAGNETSVTVYVLADNYSNSIGLAEKVRTALEKLNTSVNGITIKDSTLEDVSEDYNEFAFLQILKFKFKTN